MGDKCLPLGSWVGRRDHRTVSPDKDRIGLAERLRVRGNVYRRQVACREGGADAGADVGLDSDGVNGIPVELLPDHRARGRYRILGAFPIHRPEQYLRQNLRLTLAAPGRQHVPWCAGVHGDHGHQRVRRPLPWRDHIR